MSIVDAENAAELRATERRRARDRGRAIGDSLAGLIPFVGENVSPVNCHLDDDDAAIDAELSTAQNLQTALRSTNDRLGALAKELESAREARSRMILMLAVAGIIAAILIILMLRP